MLEIKLDKTINRLVLLTDEPGLHFFLESRENKYEFDPYKRCWGYREKIVKIYDNGRHFLGGGLFTYKIGLGWTGYVLNVFRNRISKEDFQSIQRNVILSDNYREAPFKELRDYQNDDVLYLLKYKLGLFQVQTGYGKSQTISVLTNYARSLGKKVLLVCPSNKARDELVKRIDKLYGLKVSSKPKDINGELDCIITSGLVNSSRVKNPVERSNFIKLLESYDWVLVDEVEYTINAAGEFIYDHCIGAERFYGFSGTADKELAETITFKNGLSGAVTRNAGLVKYFGPSLVYRMPFNIKVNNIKIKTKSLDNLKLDVQKLKASSNIYGELMSQIWTNPSVVNDIVRIVQAYPRCFIPLNNLNTVINTWIDKYFVGKLNTLLICFEGYIYIDKFGNKTKLTLAESCEYIDKGLVDVIPSTSSGFRALDLPGLRNILILAGKVAGVHLQSIGRVARGTEMNVLTMIPSKKSKRIPIYSKGIEKREKLMKSFYKYCDIIDLEKDIDLL